MGNWLMSKIKKAWGMFVDLTDDFLAYVLTIIGIMLSNYLPLLKTTGTIDIKADWWRMGISAMVALLIIGKQESLAIDENGSTDKAKEGRKKKFSIRMFNALSNGISWATLIDMASK
jgi:hypothetical protein